MGLIAAIRQSGLTEAQRAVREHFVQGGSAGTVLLVTIGLGVAVWLAYSLSRRTHQAGARDSCNDAHKFFRDLMRRLNLAAPQRRWLSRVANDLRLDHPAVILLSRDIFDECVGRWREENAEAPPASNRHGRFPVAAGIREGGQRRGVPSRDAVLSQRPSGLNVASSCASLSPPAPDLPPVP